MGIDQRELEPRDGFAIIVAKETDYDAAPEEFDCYSEEDKEAWHNGDWRFVTVVAKAFLDGVQLGDASLGSCEDGHLPGARSEDNPSGSVDAYAHTLGGKDCYDVPGDAVHEAKKQLVRLVAAAVGVELKGFRT